MACSNAKFIDMIPTVDSNEDMNSTRDHSVAGITFRTSRLRSSLSSLYANYDFHLDMVKVMGVIVLLSVTSATLAVTNNLHVCKSYKSHNATDCIRLTHHPVDSLRQYNSSICDFFQQFDLPQDYKATVCRYQREVRIDFRQFISGHPTIKGLYFNTRQWQYLKRLIPHIDKSITKALI
ncbi:unnamed protein product [Mytilus edulis]|uniref:Uncharacterized protein n=1 Tax=Mytilus edulis TaxID=6550 RepID=A0A8S3TRB7_MYTED|nr:unnamed protein product [Mytilus edulis]